MSAQPEKPLSDYYGKIVKLCATGTIRNNKITRKSFPPFYYVKDSEYVYGYVQEPRTGSPAELYRLSSPSQVPSLCLLLPKNLGIEYTLALASVEDCQHIRELIAGHKYRIEYGTLWTYNTEQFIKQLPHYASLILE